MKTFGLFLFACLFFLFSCHSGSNTTVQNGKNAIFGIHEVAKLGDIPAAVMDTLKSKGVPTETNPDQSVLAYLLVSDSALIHLDLSGYGLSLVQTAFPIDPQQKFHALTAIHSISRIDIHCVKEVKVKGNNVEIYFNADGAKKWADLTKANIGHQVAFVIDYQIYSMPVVNGMINNGMAIIPALPSETEAKKIVAYLTSGLPD